MNGVATNPSRSCMTCYKRKLKCDRQLPCSRCKARGSECSYPNSKITRNRPKVSESQMGLELEGSWQSLMGFRDPRSNIVKIYEVQHEATDDSEPVAIMDNLGNMRLLTAVGRVNVKDVKDVLPMTPSSQDESDVVADNDDEPTASVTLTTLLGSMSGERREVAGLYVPTPEDLEKCWTVYCRNVDPVIKMLHKPSVRRQIDAFKLLGEASCTPATYALIMTIVFAAVNSLPPNGELEELLGEGRTARISKVKAATEIALSRAELWSTHDLAALQALTLFLIIRVSDHDSIEAWLTLWSQVSLAMRMALSMNIHKDGSTLGLSPFESEMRRRLWWHLFPTAIRTSENYSCDPYTYGGGIVNMPLNIDDDNMDPESKDPYIAQEGTTEVTACIIRCEAVNAVAEAVLQHEPPPCSMLSPGLSSQEKIKHFQRLVQIKYLDQAEAHPEIPRNKLILHMGQIVILKMCWVWGIAMMRKQGNFQPILGFSGLSTSGLSNLSNLSDGLLMTAVKTLDVQLNLQTDPTFKDWQWILWNFNSCHAVAIILTQLLARIKVLPDKRLEHLPPILRDAWEVSELGFRRAVPWSAQKKVLGPLIKIRKEIQVMLGLNDERESVEACGQAMQGLYHNNGISQETEIDMEGLEMPLEGFAGDPWPLFIPTSFFVGSGF